MRADDSGEMTPPALRLILLTAVAALLPAGVASARDGGGHRPVSALLAPAPGAASSSDTQAGDPTADDQSTDDPSSDDTAGDDTQDPSTGDCTADTSDDSADTSDDTADTRSATASSDDSADDPSADDSADDPSTDDGSANDGCAPSAPATTAPSARPAAPAAQRAKLLHRSTYDAGTITVANPGIVVAQLRLTRAGTATTATTRAKGTAIGQVRRVVRSAGQQVHLVIHLTPAGRRKLRKAGAGAALALVVKVRPRGAGAPSTTTTPVTLGG
jgi:hypothetical protein